MNQQQTHDVGALSAINPQDVCAALALARRGQVYDLGVDLGNQTPRLPSDVVFPFTLSQYRTPAGFEADASMRGNSFCAEVIQGSLHQSSHIDALIHAQRYGRVYGGGTVAELFGDFGWRAFGAETIPPIVSRGVVIDTVGVVGHTPVPDGYSISAEELQAAVQAQDLRLQPGDTVLIRTGKIVQYATDRAAFETGCPGLSGPAARWLVEQGMIVFGLDATSADPHPVPDWDDTVHEELLIKRGIHIIENLNLEALVHDGVHEFAFICLPLRIQSATGSWVRPIAIA